MPEPCYNMKKHFSGAVDNSHDTLMWILYYMAMYPDKQQILQNELDSVKGGSSLFHPPCAGPYEPILVLWWSSMPLSDITSGLFVHPL